MLDVLYQPFPMQGRSRGQVWRYSPEHRRPRHFHSEPELNLITQGRGLLQVGATQLPIAAGDLCWLLPGQDHELLEASADFDLFVIGLTPELSARVLDASGALPWTGQTRLRLSPGELRALSAACERGLTASDSTSREHSVGEVWHTAHTFALAAQPSRSVTRRALASLFEQPEITRADVARLTKSDPSDVSRYFHHDTGLTLGVFRTRLRLLRFIALVDRGSPSLQTAALQAGFGSYSQCHRAFQRAFACAPRTFFTTSQRQVMADQFAPWATA